MVGGSMWHGHLAHVSGVAWASRPCLGISFQPRARHPCHFRQAGSQPAETSGLSVGCEFCGKRIHFARIWRLSSPPRCPCCAPAFHGQPVRRPAASSPRIPTRRQACAIATGRQGLTRSAMTERKSIFISSVQKELERAAVAGLIATDPFLLQHCAPLLFEQEPPPHPAQGPYLDALRNCAVCHSPWPLPWN